MKVALEPGEGCCAVACQRARATSLRAEWLCHAQFRSGSGAECARSRKPVPLHLRAAQTTTLEVAVGGPARPAQDPQGVDRVSRAHRFDHGGGHQKPAGVGGPQAGRPPHHQVARPVSAAASYRRGRLLGARRILPPSRWPYAARIRWVSARVCDSSRVHFTTGVMDVSSKIAPQRLTVPSSRTRPTPYCPLETLQVQGVNRSGGDPSR